MSKLTATNAGSFPKEQVGNILYLGNLFNGSANGNPQDVQICFDIPLTNEADPCNTTVNGPCKISFQGQGTRENGGGVMGFPNAVLGSQGGRFDTWGVECGNSVTLPGQRDSGSQATPVFDLNIPANAVGYPAQVGSLPQTTVNV